MAQEIQLGRRQRQESVVPRSWRADADRLDLRIDPFHRADEGIVPHGVPLDRDVSQLPGAEHFVADAPPTHAIGRRDGPSARGPRGW